MLPLTFPSIGIALGGIGAAAASMLALPAPASLFAAGLALLCALVAAVDIERLIIPDTASLSIAALGMAETAMRLPSGEWPAAFIDVAARCAAAGGVLWLVRWAYMRWRGHHGLGLGDVKLAAASGAWLAWEALPLALQIAVVIALAAIGGYALRDRQMPDRHAALPFGACLAPAIWAAFVLERL